MLKQVRSVRSSLETLGRIVPLLWRSEPVGVTLLAINIGVQAALPALTLYLTKWTVDAITRLGQPDYTFPLLTLVGFWLFLQLVQPLLNITNQLLQGNIAEKFTAYINLNLMTKAEELLGLDVLEGKAFHDDLKVLQDGASNRPMNLVVLLALTVRDILSIISLMIILGTLAWWVPLALLVATLPATLATIRLRDMGFQALLNNSEDGRVMAYTSRVALGFRYAHEVRLFNLIPWLSARYENLFLKTHNRMRSVRRKEVTQILPTYVLSIGMSAGLFSWAVWRASVGRLTAGQVVIILQALSQTLFAMRDIVTYVGLLYERILYFEKYLNFLSITSGVKQPTKPVTLEERAAYEIEFEEVSFTYPGGQTALKNVSFKVEVGETIALVGENGAGKSTIIKLLLRFYDPDSGRILIQGRDLRELDLIQWRKAVSAVFQDFNKYEFTIRENVAIGDLNCLDNDSLIADAVGKAALLGSLAKLPGGLDTQLGKEFGGAELSGGQWQKVAIARALLRNSGVLVLDEPTASIDPRSEHMIFKRFADMAKVPTTMLITHRLASVKMADRIFVMRNGELIQSGSHKSLLEHPVSTRNCGPCKLRRMSTCPK